MPLPASFPLILASLALASCLTACATLETGADHVRDFAVRHPIVTAVGAALIVGGVAASLDHHAHQHQPATDSCVAYYESRQGASPAQASIDCR